MAETTDVSTAETADVLEFGLDGERYCVNISYISEIVAREDLTSVPNTPEWGLGVQDLRGESLQILDPKARFGVDGDPEGERVVVMVPEVGDDERITGWLVDTVHDVLTVNPEEVDEDVDGVGVHGALRPEDRMVIWVDPIEVFS